MTQSCGRASSFFKEVPDHGTDLVAVIVDDAAKTVAMWRISVKLGNANSIIKGKTKAKSQCATEFVARLNSAEARVLDTLTTAAAVVYPDYTVKVHRAIATVRHLQPAATEVFNAASVHVWGREVLAPRWPKRIADVAAKNDRLAHYRVAQAAKKKGKTGTK